MDRSPENKRLGYNCEFGKLRCRPNKKAEIGLNCPEIKREVLWSSEALKTRREFVEVEIDVSGNWRINFLRSKRKSYIEFGGLMPTKSGQKDLFLLPCDEAEFLTEVKNTIQRIKVCDKGLRLNMQLLNNRAPHVWKIQTVFCGCYFEAGRFVDIFDKRRLAQITSTVFSSRRKSEQRVLPLVYDPFNSEFVFKLLGIDRYPISVETVIGEL